MLKVKFGSREELLEEFDEQIFNALVESARCFYTMLGSNA